MKSLFKREVDLDLHTARISCDEQANQMWLKFVDKQTDAFSSVSTFQRAASTISKGVELQSKITAATKNSIQRFAGKQFALLTMGTSSTTRENHSILPYGRLTIDKDGFFIWARVHLSLVKVIPLVLSLLEHPL